MKKPGRPRRFEREACPVCGEAGGLLVERSRRQGSLRVVYAVCERCGAKPVYVNAPGERGHWRRVRILEATGAS